jgi:hypothetical protein
MIGAKLLTDGLLDLPSDRGATELLQALFADSVQPSHHTCPDHLPFQFAESAGHLDHRLAERAGAVDRLLIWVESISAIAVATCRTRLPRRSMDQTMSTSNRRRTASLSIWLNAGR